MSGGRQRSSAGTGLVHGTVVHRSLFKLPLHTLLAGHGVVENLRQRFIDNHFLSIPGSPLNKQSLQDNYHEYHHVCRWLEIHVHVVVAEENCHIYNISCFLNIYKLNLQNYIYIKNSYTILFSFRPN